MQQGTLNSITITIFLKRPSTEQKTISFVAMEKASVVKKNYPSIRLLHVAPPLAGPSLFQLHWGFTVFTPCPVSYCICHPAGLPAGKSTLGVLVAVLSVGSQSILVPSLIL